MPKKLHPVITARLFTDKKCFGPGVAELLHRVDEHGSLRSAAGSMEMAYSKAWTIIKNAESCLNVKLIVSSTGGKNGGGAELTKEARHILKSYESYYNKLVSYSESVFNEEFKDFLP